MRTKILLFPLLLLIIISALVWMIIPDWKIIQTKKADLAEREKQLEEAQAKNSIVDNLINTYRQKTEERNLIEEYVPNKVNDEEIINNFIYYANIQSGDNVLSVSDISVSKPVISKKQPVMPAIPQMPEGDFNNSMLPEDIMGARMAIGTPLADPVSFNAEVSFVGKYQGVKEFFSKLKALKRANSVSSFSISKNENDNSGALNVKATLAFNYLDQYNPQEVDGSLLANNLDMSVVENIKNATSDVMKVTVDSKGRENPFLP